MLGHWRQHERTGVREHGTQRGSERSERPWQSGFSLPLVFLGVGVLVVGGFFLHRQQRLGEFRSAANCETAATAAGPAREFCRRIPLRIDRRWSSSVTRVTQYRFDLSEPSGGRYPSVRIERAAHDAGREGDIIEGLIWRGDVVSITWPGATHMTLHHPARIPFFWWNMLATFATCFVITLVRALFRRSANRRR
jgi:hypothetical protein